MTLKLLLVGKTDSSELTALITDYATRLKHYVKFELIIIPDLKNTKNVSEKEQKTKEGELILKQVNTADHVILFDEMGKHLSSMEFSTFLQKKMNSGLKNLLFVVGGPYGFSEQVYARSNGKLSLSKMTFSHQMVRLFIVEQCYRAFTILRNEPYHHQ